MPKTSVEYNSSWWRRMKCKLGMHDDSQRCIRKTNQIVITEYTCRHCDRQKTDIDYGYLPGSSSG